MPEEEGPYHFLGYPDKTAVESLQHEGKVGPVPAILGGEEMRRFMEYEEAIKIAVLDRDAMACDIGKARDTGIIEARHQLEDRGPRAMAGENLADEPLGFHFGEKLMAGGKGRKEILFEAADACSEIAEKRTRHDRRTPSGKKGAGRSDDFRGAVKDWCGES